MTMSLSLAPELQVQTWFNTERPLLLSGLRDRIVVLVAFQVLCPKSISYGIPQAQRIYETFEPSDVAVIGLHATFEHHDAFSSAVLKAFIHEYRLKFPIALDQPNMASPIPHTMERYKMRGTPSLVLIDKQGLIRKHTFGPVDDLRIGAEIGALTQESSGQTAALAQSSAA
jgi:AhpC/TSA family